MTKHTEVWVFLKSRVSPALLGAVISVAAMLNVGCGKSDWSYVEGVVTVNGQPVGPGFVGFKPADPKAPGGGIGEFDGDGHYIVHSSGHKEGIPPGEYLVYVKGGALGDTGASETTSAAPGVIPGRYALTTTSGLKVTVKPGKQTHNIPLEP